MYGRRTKLDPPTIVSSHPGRLIELILYQPYDFSNFFARDPALRSETVKERSKVAYSLLTPREAESSFSCILQSYRLGCALIWVRSSPSGPAWPIWYRCRAVVGPIHRCH